MRILIVNAYSTDNNGIVAFNNFEHYIMKFLAEQKELVDTENEFFVRDRDSIEDFLYEIESSYVKKESASKFDQVDLIFLAGDPNIRPWSVQMKKILTLLRMCLKVKKLLFACSFGMQALVFLSASNIEIVFKKSLIYQKPIKLINGLNGGNISDIKTLIRPLISIKQSDYFLDNTTGDLYTFSYETAEWVPRSNIGLHYRKAAQEFQQIGKYIVKAPTYKPRDTLTQTGLLYKTKTTETILSIKKSYYHHWAFDDVAHKFLCPMQNTWDVHAFSFINLQKSFVPLAESDEGPNIIEFTSFLSCMFDIDPRYPETLKILNNFIIHSLRQIKSCKTELQYDSIQNFHQLIKESTLNQILQKQYEKVIQCLKYMIKKQKSSFQSLQARTKSLGLSEFKEYLINENQDYDDDQKVCRHVGFTVQKSHMPQHVKQNSVWEKKFKMSEGSLTSKQQTSTKSKGTLHMLSEGQQADKYSKISLPAATLANEMSLKGHYQQHQDKTAMKEQKFSQTEVRAFLHPQMSESCFGQKHLWVPGQLSRQRMVQSKSTIISLSGFKKQQKKYIDTSKDNFKRNLASEEPYQTYDQIARRQQIEADKKILGSKIFKVYNGTINKQDIIYSPEKFAQNVSNFREFNKDKWVVGQDFVV